MPSDFDKCEDKQSSNRSKTNGSTVLTSRFPKGSVRPRALLAYARRDHQFCDGIICVGDEEFPIHRLIVTSLCPFFANAFSGSFSEAHAGKVIVGETTPDAMSVVLDFAYCIDVNDALNMDEKLACEVLELSHRFEIFGLLKIAGAAVVKSATVENCVSLFSKAKLLGCMDETDSLFLFVVQRYEEIFEAGDDFNTLTANELADFLSSEELIATEYCKYKSIKSWAAAAESRNSSLDILLSKVHFELLSKTDIQKVVGDVDFLPKLLLCKAMETYLSKGMSIAGVYLPHIYPRKGVKFETLMYPEATSVGADFALPLGKLKSEFMVTPTSPYFFVCNNWVISARVALHSAAFELVFKFEQRISSKNPSLFLAEDLDPYYFQVMCKLVSEKKNKFETLLFTDMKADGNHLIATLYQCSDTWTFGEKFDDEVRGSLTLLINFRCVEERADE